MGKRANEVKRGFLRAGEWLLGFAWLGLVFAGMAIALTPSPHSPALGWAFLTLAAVIALATMDRWVKVFPALLAYGVLGSLFTLVDGHAVNHPEVSVTPIDGVFAILLFAGAAVLSLGLMKRELKIADRMALFAFVFCFFWQAAVPKFGRLALGLGFGSLLIAWTYDRIHTRRRADAGL
jgi:NhaP-type Na+/H+ or K+/H+ antiporter